MSKDPKSRSRRLFILLVFFAFIAGGLAFISEGPGRELLEDRGVHLPWQPLFASSPYNGEMNSMVYGGIPKGPSRRKIRKNRAFALAWDEEWKSPLWVAYRLPALVRKRSPGEPGEIEEDGRVKGGPSEKDFGGKGYAPCRLAPHRAIHSRFGEDAGADTALSSNILPQKIKLHDGPWSVLEEKISGGEGWAEKAQDLWVIAGPVFDMNLKALESGVEIPDAFYKIIVHISESGGNARVLAFMMANVDKATELPYYLVSVDEIEEVTGLDFFPELDDETENALESEKPKSLW
ncbi:MAG: DNA/RNA non-specific endonuclease [Planctomycetota bacterium]|jgi:endonuclease G